jgi:sulfur-oxidizing protein SoxX
MAMIRFFWRSAAMVTALLTAAAFADGAKEGREIFMGRGAGNCLACHAVVGAESPGNMGPPLAAVKTRFPQRADLRARLWDPTQFNPLSAMPPFGKHGILSEEQIERLIDYLYTL